MHFFKKIIFLAFVFNAGIIFSQEKINSPPPSPQNLPPEADFSWLNACAGDTTCFINQTIRGNTYTWTVTDTSTKHPATLYTDTSSSGFCFVFTAGYYYVSLSAYNNHLVTNKKLIKIDSITKAAFSFIHCSNDLNNTSTCASSFYWDFGDGTNSTLAIPKHPYADTGRYNVTLIAYKGLISDTLKQQITVDVTSFASANYTHSVSHDSVFVHANYSGTGTNYYWTWADGTYSTGQDTFHVYKDSTALYTVQLYVINACGPISYNDSIRIFKGTTTIPQAPSALDFLNTTLNIVPNPVSENGYLEAFYNAYTDDNYLTQVYDALGQKLFESYFAFTSGVNGFKINTSNLSEGMYVLVLQSGNSFIRKKFYIMTKP